MVSRGASSRVALLACGSFNPPTMAHLRMLEVARDHVESQGVHVVDGVFSPVADQFAKPGLVSARHRLAMLSAGLANTWMRADGWECTRETWTRTLQVMRHHREEIRARLGDPHIGLMLVVGGDVVESFTRILADESNLWNPEDVRQIIADFGLVVIVRENSNPVSVLRSMPVLQGCVDRVQVITDDTCPCDVSSTRLRKAIATGKSIRFATPDAIIAYIQQHSLYVATNNPKI